MIDFKRFKMRQQAETLGDAPDREDYVLGMSTSGFHKVAYSDWGPLDDKRPVICVHGLTRQGRDFDHLAAHLARNGRRVICPDLPGRGRSGRLMSPELYALPQYCSDMNALIARLNVMEVDWVGTSLGGLIGMAIAGSRGSVVRRLVVNDIGPYVPSTGLLRISNYLKEMPCAFTTIAEADRYFRTVLAPYGDLSDAQWAHLTEHSLRWNDAIGRFDMLCDPAVSYAYRSTWLLSFNIWKYWEAITAPILVLHGIRSDLLTRELTLEMQKRNPRAAIVRFDDCGHVPPLLSETHIAPVVNFLLEREEQASTR